MNKQRGGKLRVSGWLALLFLALCATAAETQLQQPDKDYFVTRSFPSGRSSCNSDTICYVKI